MTAGIKHKKYPHKKTPLFEGFFYGALIQWGIVPKKKKPAVDCR
jgi:hypothetical protein